MRSTTRSKAFATIVFAFCLVTSVTRSVVAAGETQLELIRSAEESERNFEFRAALDGFHRAEALAPRNRLARRAQDRARYLEARSEGDFVPLTAFERLRRNPRPSLADVAELERACPGFPAGRVRREARALVAETYLGRLEAYADAVRAHDAWLDEPGLDDAEFLRASNGLALSRARLGDVHGSLDVLRAHGLGKSAEATFLELALVRRWARPLAYGSVILFALFAFVTRKRHSLSGAVTPGRLFAVVWVIGIPLLMAKLHRPETWRTFSYLAPAATLVLLVAALCAGARSERQKWALATLGVLAQVAVAYLALDASGALLGWLVARRLA